MVVAYVIIPGIDGSDGQHWQTMWERQWGASAVRIFPASWSAPDLDDWVNAVHAAYEVARRQDSRVVLVAHSLGCWATSSWLDKNPSSPVRGAFLVAPPDPQGPAFPRQAAATFLEVSAQPLPCRALVVGSTNDPYCTTEAAVDFAARWQARWHVLGAWGHITPPAAWAHGRAAGNSLIR